jgi:hypothetical protein
MTEPLDISLQAFVESCETDKGSFLYDAKGIKHYILRRDKNGFTLSPVGLQVKENILVGHPIINQPCLMNVDIDSSPQLLILYCKVDALHFQLIIPSCVGLSKEARLKGITHICTLSKGNSKECLIPIVPMLFSYQ